MLLIVSLYVSETRRRSLLMNFGCAIGAFFCQELIKLFVLTFIDAES